MKPVFVQKKQMVLLAAENIFKPVCVIVNVVIFVGLQIHFISCFPARQNWM
ncbi:MAG TPA: hypothetical protein PLA88_01495 [Bacteroidales bacterium]|nr:hypothetical protein [Bacteroidales bacterium]